MIKIHTIIFALLIGIFSCTSVENEKAPNKQEAHTHKKHDHGHNHANKHMHKNSVADLIKSFESKERAATQKPYEVIALFGEVEGLKILDIGSGSGYFTFRLAEKGAHVIAGDVSDEFHDFIRGQMKTNKQYQENIELRKLPYDGPALKDKEVDAAIIVNTYHHIENRVAYFQKVKQGLKDDGTLMVVDFMKKKFDVEVEGPPYEMRLSKDLVISELTKAGFNSFDVNETLLPFQYVIIAKK